MVTYFDAIEPRRARAAAGYGLPTASSSGALSPEQRESLMQQVQDRSMSGAELLFSLIDTPASYLRDWVSGRPLGSDTTPGEMLDSFGLRPGEDTLGGFARPVADFAAGAIVDPLNLIGVGGMSKAAKAASGVTTLRGTSLLDDASRVMSRRLLDSGETGSRFSKSALDSWRKNFGITADRLTDEDLLVRPLAGARQSRRSLTLDDLVRAQDNPDEIVSALNHNLRRSGQTFDDVAKQPLRYDFGLGMPFSDYSSLGINLPGGAGLARNLDRLGQIARWSAPVRHANAAFNRDVFGATDEAGQILGQRVSDAIRNRQHDTGLAISDALQELIPDVMDDADLAASMRRILGGYGRPADLDLINPASAAYRRDLHEFVENWRGPGGIAEEFLQRRMDAGLSSRAYKSRFSGEYYPRHIDDLSYASKIEERMLTGLGGRSSRGGRRFSTMTGDQMARRRAYDVPGGEDLLNRLGLDPNVAGPNRLKTTDDSAAQYIKDIIDQEIAQRYPLATVNGKQVRVLPDGSPVPEYKLQTARSLARDLHQLDATSIAEGLPIFGSHFTDDFARYIRGNERAIATTDVLYDFLAGSAKRIRPGQVDGGGHITLGQAAKSLGLKTVREADGTVRGAKQQLVSRLQKFFPDASEQLRDYAIDKRLVQRLSAIADFYESPRVQKQWVKFADDITRIWKASILAWPSRFTRDWYSGGFSNLVEVGSLSDLNAGYRGAQALIQGQMDRLDEILARMPRYAGMTADKRVKRFRSELASSGLLTGRRSADISDAASALQSGVDVADEFVPGMNARTTLGYQIRDALSGRTPLGSDKAAYSRLFRDWDKVAEVGFKRSRDVKNPLMRWGQELGDTTDSINRSAGYIALLMQGVDPIQASKRMKLAHVDYSSLTTFERNTIRRFIPFWSFSSRIGRWVSQKLYENPGGRFTQFGLRAPQTLLAKDDEYTPDSIRTSYGSRIPSWLARPFSGAEEGATPFVNSIALPGVSELNYLTPKFQASGRLDATQTAWNSLLQFVSGSLHPAARYATELATGQNLYTKRPMEDFTPVLSEIARDYGGIPPESAYGKVIKQGAMMLDMVPFTSRPMQVLNRLTDYERVPDFRDRLYQMGVNAFTGVQMQNVSDRARAIDVSRNIREMSEDDPNVREMSIPYVREESKPFINPLLLQLLELNSELKQEAADARAAERGQVVKPRGNRRGGYWQ